MNNFNKTALFFWLGTIAGLLAVILYKMLLVLDKLDLIINQLGSY